MARTNAQARRQLDARLQQLRPLVEARPHRGWIRAIRDALGMSSTELAARMGVTQPTVQDLEHSEVFNTVKLETLQRAANALDCDLAYALVPRTSLDAAVKAQARRKAAQHLGPLAHHSRLEDQATSDSDTAAQLEELAARFMDRQGLWSEPDE
jgi:predicted DNA-binding mobile mystery protein A